MSTPQHTAFILDGNRRWAKAHGLLSWQGHEEGAKRVWDIGSAAKEFDIDYLTFWVGSYDNLRKRTSIEVNALFNILASEIAKPDLLDLFNKNQTRVRVIGEWEMFAKDQSLVRAVRDIEEQTSHHTQRTITILFGYDGRREMLAAIRGVNEASLEVTAENVRSRLWTHYLPDVDLVVRTGGEPHWSAGFMMWLTANSQFYFTDTLWPDFSPDKLKTALEDFESRERRLGK